MKHAVGVLFDIVIFGSLYIGFFYGVQGATNIGYFAGWFFGLINLLCMLAKPGRERAAAEYKHQSIIWRIYDLITDVAYVCFVVFSGWFVLGTIYALQAAAKVQFKIEQEKALSKAQQLDSE